MDDRKLENLLSMALEVEDLERSGASPSLRLVGASPRRRSWLLPLATAAAAVAVVTVILPSMNPPARPINWSGNQSPTHATPPVVDSDFSKPLMPSETPALANKTDDEASVVLAFFEGLDGRCTCVHIQDEEWDIDELASKDRGELLDVAYRSKCGSISPNLLVVAIAGKRDALPRSPEEAEALGSELSRHRQAARADLVDRAYQAVPGLPTGSMIVTETVGNRNALLDYAKFSGR